MRWERLFADLEARWEAEASAELDAEVADRTRWERGQVALPDRLAAARATGVTVRVTTAAGELTGVVEVVGADWFVVTAGNGGEVLVPLPAVVLVSGLGTGAETAVTVQRRLGLSAALRRISRDRATVRVEDVHGGTRTGTIDAVGADHLDLAVHPVDEPRRRTSVTSHVAVPFAALAGVHRARGPVQPW